MKKYTTLLLVYICLEASCFAQATEFKKGYIMHGRWQNGLVTAFNSTPELYTGSLQLVPQYTIAENYLRAGAVAGLAYSSNTLFGLFGPTASLRIKTFEAGEFGSIGNIHATIEHLWGTEKQKLAGGGLHVDLLNKVIIGLTAHRDYEWNNWWLQSAIAIRLNKNKTVREPFNE